MIEEVEIIKNVVCEYLGVSPMKIYSKTRKREIVQARQLVQHFAKKYTRLSLAKIGFETGNKDHATIMYANKTVKDLVESNKDFEADYQIMDDEIKGRLKNKTIAELKRFGFKIHDKIAYMQLPQNIMLEYVHNDTIFDNDNIDFSSFYQLINDTRKSLNITNLHQLSMFVEVYKIVEPCS